MFAANMPIPHAKIASTIATYGEQVLQKGFCSKCGKGFFNITNGMFFADTSNITDGKAQVIYKKIDDNLFQCQDGKMFVAFTGDQNQILTEIFTRVDSILKEARNAK